MDKLQKGLALGIEFFLFAADRADFHRFRIWFWGSSMWWQL